LLPCRVRARDLGEWTTPLDHIGAAMQPFQRLILGAIAAVAIVASLPAPGAAQGVTTGAVRGSVQDSAGHPIVGATLVLVDRQTGLRNTVTSRSNGQYNLENVTPGGPFTLSVRAIGYGPVTQDGIMVALGQVVTLNLKMAAVAVTLEALTVTAQSNNPLLSRARTGAAMTISDSFIRRLPILSRNFTDLVATVPQANGNSIAGQNNRFNNIQIDGGVNNDLFGLGSSGTPGGQVNERPISLEAVKEFQVLIAPFDVRQGGFTGGLVNAVTKSGTNTFHGSVFGYGQNQSFARDSVNRDPLGADLLTDFHEYQYGGTLSGPIIKNKLQFFAAVDLKSRAAPFVGYLQGNDAIDKAAYGGLTKGLADSVAAWSAAHLGDAGATGQASNSTPDHDIFVKLNGQVSGSSQVELSFNHVTASDGTLIRSSSFSSFRSGYELGNAGYRINNTTQTGRLRYNAALGGGLTNELMLGYQRIRDLRDPGMNTPLIFVGNGTGAGSAISIGAERFSQGNVLKQDIYEVSDNLTFGVGHHLFTVGTHNEFFKFSDQFFPGSYGVWGFASSADLYAGTPNHYEIALPLRPNGPLAEFSVNQLGLYAEDIWNVTPKFSLTYGLRVDAPMLPTKPEANPALAAIDFTHVNLGVTGSTDQVSTSDFSTAALWSPRLGFNFDVNGDQSMLIRGGIGVFTGRPPYVWVANAYGNSGLTQAQLTCSTPASIPTFTTDLASQPTSCVGGGAPNPPVPSIVYFDHGFKFPQTMRAALGLDRRLPGGVVATVDLLYTRTLNQFYLNDVNLVGVQSKETGEGGRLLYGAAGAPNGSGIAAVIKPTRVTTTAADVIRQSNSSGDNSISATLQLNKRFSNHVSFNAGFTHSRTQDRECLTSSISNSSLKFAVLQGPLDDRPLETSCFDVPNKLALTGIFDIPLGFQASVIYTGFSSTPFTYTVNSDANGDGLAGNDPIYVPRDSADINLRTPSDWSALNAYINSEPCLNSARGTVLERNACRGPWTSFLNARVTKVVPTVHGQALEISLDIFNLPNLLSSSWGVNRSTTGFENQAILNETGYDVAGSRGQYTTMLLTSRNAVVANSSRYRLLLSGKYTF
jgi:carboxypeptidase family protein/TonB-dependent receptor-like protein